MSSPQRLSDTEGSEKPVRERLRNTSIAAPSATNGASQDIQSNNMAGPLAESIPEAMVTTDSNSSDPSEDDKARGRPSRKRSHEDIGDPSQNEPAAKSRHGRKRSRETVDEDDQDKSPKRNTSGEQARPVIGDNTNGVGQEAAIPKRHVSGNKRPATPADEEDASATVERVASPKTKKSRSESTRASIAPEPEAQPSVAERIETEPNQDKREIKASGIPPTSGFANASAAAPFGALAGSRSPTDQQPTASAFKSSGFGALAGSSSSSGFASLAGTASKLSSFASSSPAPSTTAAAGADKSENNKPTTSAFGGALGASSPFAAAGAGAGNMSSFGTAASSGFGNAGKSGFGSAIGSGFGGL